MHVSLPSFKNHQITTIFLQKICHCLVVNLYIREVEMQLLLLENLLSSIVDYTFILGSVIAKFTKHCVGLSGASYSVENDRGIVTLLQIVHVRLDGFLIHLKISFLRSEHLVKSVNALISTAFRQNSATTYSVEEIFLSFCYSPMAIELSLIRISIGALRLDKGLTLTHT